MQVTVEKLPKSRVKLTIELSVEHVQPALEAAAQELSTQHPVKGFRPGSVPLSVIRSVAGDQPLVEKALQRLVPKTYVEALLEHEEIEAVGRPEVSAVRVDIGQPWVYEATVAVLPAVTLGQYKALRGERREITVEPSEVDSELDMLRKMRASYLDVARAAQQGDRVEADVRMSSGNVPLEHGSATNQQIMLGEGTLVPGFEEQLLGMRAGDAKKFPLTFPEKHYQPELRSRTVDCAVSVRSVQQRILPALDDAFAKGVGVFATLQELRDKLSSNIRAEKEEKERQRLQLSLLEQVVQGTTFGEIPDLLLAGEVEKMFAELESGLASSGLTLEHYVTMIQKTKETVRAEFAPQALERIRSGLTLRALAAAERVVVEDSEAAEEAQKVLQQFPSAAEAKKRLDPAELLSAASGAVRNRKVFLLLEKFAGLA